MIDLDNSYLTLQEIDTAMNNRLNYRGFWNTLADVEKEIYVLEAMWLLESLQYKGTLISDTQPLAFPRSYGTLVDYFIVLAMAEGKVPEQIKKAQVEIICQLIDKYKSNDGIVTKINGRDVKSATVGMQTITFVDLPTDMQDRYLQETFNNTTLNLISIFLDKGSTVRTGSAEAIRS